MNSFARHCTYEMSNARYVNIINVTLLKWLVFHLLKLPMISSLYVGSSLSVLVMAFYQSDGLEIEAVFQSFGPTFDAPVLTSHSGK